MPIPFAAFVPMIAAAGQNILQGINNRNARAYNSPVQQVKRLREAGLPLAAGTSIQAGGGVATPVSDFGTQGFNDNIGKGTIRQTDKQTLEKVKHEVTKAEAEAAIAAGQAKNQLNPAGTFENTNQGAKIQQDLVQQEEAIKSAQTVNKFMPIEKAQNLLKGTQEINKISADIQNTLTANKIQIQDLAIKKILARYQPKMSFNELQSLIKSNAGQDLRNAGMDTENAIKKVAYSIEWQTELARITMARNAALASGQALEAGRLSNLLTTASLPSTLAYYEIRRGMDEGTLAKPNLANTLLYLGMFQPNTSNYNLGQLMPSYKGGNTYEQHTHFKTE